MTSLERLAGGRLRGALAVLLALALASGAAAPARATASTGSVSAHGSAEQVYATGLPPGAAASLLDPRGRRLSVRRADPEGGVLFRNVRPGDGYRVRLLRGGATSPPVSVMSARPAPPSTAVYDQSIPASGYGYITMRDGIKLAVDVHPPSDISDAAPAGIHAPPSGQPTPTLIEYAGYGYADPAGPQNGISIIANLLGFTVVDVNMRGTGCSGGAYDFFEPLQNLDGYDLIETIARQPWVLHHRVGMMGISYGGISQLFTAQLDPPHLAAISPLSVLDSTQTTLYPGGVLNTGFAVAWALERVHDAKPASAKGGQPWAYQRIQNGDATCRENQALHGQAPNLLAKIRANSHYVPSVADPLSPLTFVNRINVPVFMACQWTDEQTGGHCPDLAEHMTGTQRKWFTFTNGTHVDSLDPDTLNRLYDFLELYVAQQAPITNSAALQAGGPVIYNQAMNITGVTMPPDPIQQQPTYDSALAAFQALPAIRVLFDNGAGSGQAGAPYPAFEQSWPSFPIPGTQARTWYLTASGGLGDRPPARRGLDVFRWNAHALPMNDFTGDSAAGQNGLWTATPVYDWRQWPAGSAVSYMTAPLTRNTTVIGAGAARVWVRSSARSVDLQATVTEIRPDGMETFVQDGWVRANERKLDARRSTLLEPVLSLRARDVSPMPRGRFVPVTIPLYYEGHTYRAGSRLRITIAAPNGAQPIWSFAQTSPRGTATVAIGTGGRMPSALVMPVVEGVAVSGGLPPCPGLRGEPCRAYKPYRNRRIAR